MRQFIPYSNITFVCLNFISLLLYQVNKSRRQSRLKKAPGQKKGTAVRAGPDQNSARLITGTIVLVVTIKAMGNSSYAYHYQCLSNENICLPLPEGGFG